MKLKYIFGLSVAALLASCEIVDTIEDTVDDVKNIEKATEAIKDYSTAVSTFSLVEATGDLYVVNAQAEAKIDEATALKTESIISIDPFDATTFPKTITVDFGDGVTGIDGSTRKGKMMIELESAWTLTVGSSRIITFDNFYQDNSKIEGTYLTERVNDVAGMASYEVTISDGKITESNGDVITYNRNTTRTQVEVGDPMDYTDDSYEIEGTQDGLSSNGYSYQFVTRSGDPLLYSFECLSIKSGILDVAEEGIDLALDYGDASEGCDDDNSATLIYKGLEYEIEL